MPRLILPEYTVSRDTREKVDHGWDFDPDPVDYYPPRCLGTVRRTLKVGDYSVVGYEDVFVIERKLDISELWTNYSERKRFEKELESMMSIKHRFIIVETNVVRDFYKLSPPQYTRNVPGKALQDWMAYLMIKYQTPILFEGDMAKQKAKYLMKQVVRLYKDRWAVKQS